MMLALVPSDRFAILTLSILLLFGIFLRIMDGR